MWKITVRNSEKHEGLTFKKVGYTSDDELANEFRSSENYEVSSINIPDGTYEITKKGTYFKQCSPCSYDSIDMKYVAYTNDENSIEMYQNSVNYDIRSIKTKADILFNDIY